MSITSDEVNLLVYRYLQESGFVHSAFAFAHESLVSRSSVADADLPPGALISFLQKGLQYVEVESHLTETGDIKKCHNPFSLTAPHICKTPGRADEDVDMGGSAEADGAAARPEDVTLLHGHKSEVFTCKWNPKSDLLASGSSDATARIWPVGADGGAFVEPAVLAHIGAGKSKDVATLDWSPDGALLATGSYDGKARIWTKNGDLRHTLSRHEGPVFSLKWNNSGTALLSAGVDKSTVVWDPASGEVKQQFAFHTAPTLDVDWQSDDTFASCSTDYLIHVCQMGADKPVRTYSGHKNEVNAIQWDPSSRYLASCSDDTTAKVWTLTGDEPAADLREHKKEIYTLTWSPTATGPPTLATASFDATVKLWDVEAGRCSQTLSRHRSMVYAVSFSPDGQFVATGSLDRYLHIHSVRDGALVRTYKGGGGIFEVDWNASGDKVAACFSNNVVTVLDFRK